MISVSPIAVGATAWAARTRGYSVRKYAIIGGLLSWFYIAPWFHLLNEMTDEPTNPGVVWVVYGLLYIVWFMGPIAGPLALLLPSITGTAVDSGLTMVPVANIGMTALNLAICLLSIYSMQKPEFVKRFVVGEEGARVSLVHIAPFVLVAVCSLLTILALRADLLEL